LGIREYPLIAGTDRAPVWPTGVVGSITHCKGFTGAVVARREEFGGIGLDAEGAAELDEKLVPYVCTDAERAWTAVATSGPRCGWPKAFFSAKEAVHKCIAPASGVTLGFRDVEVRFSPDPGSPEEGEFTARRVGGSAGVPDLARLTGRFAVNPTHVFAGAVIG
jgi:4'-phosphopantetheinyl transferase EntD